MIRVYLKKRLLRKKKRNGKREYRWMLRWEDSGGYRSETTGTADKTLAETIRKAKSDELNNPQAVPPPPKRPTWDDCRVAIKRAMAADNLRPGYINDALMLLDMIRRGHSVDSPADITPAMANEWKRKRGEAKISPWTTRGDLTTLKAVFGKWLVQELGLLSSNPFAAVKAPKCDDPEIRIIVSSEVTALATWFAEQWGDWPLPLVYLDVLGTLGWRATEVASIKSADLLDEGFVRVTSDVVKTRRTKIGWLPSDLMDELRACSAGGFAFGRFSDELRRRLMLVRKRPHHAARVKDFTPKRLVGWWQDQLREFGGGFTLHDFRRTAVSGLHMAGVSEKESSVLLGVSPEVMRRHYELLDQRVIAKRSIQKRLGEQPAQSGRAFGRAAQKRSLDDAQKSSQTASA